MERHKLDECEVHLRYLQQHDIPWQLRPWYHRTCLLLHAKRGNRILAEAAERDMFDALNHQGMNGLYAPESLIAACAANLWLGNADVAGKHGEAALRIAREADMNFWRMKATAWLAWVFRRSKAAVTTRCWPTSASRCARHAREDLKRSGTTTSAVLPRCCWCARWPPTARPSWARRMLQNLGVRAHEGLAAVLANHRPEAEQALACQLLGQATDARVVASLKLARRRGTELVQVAADQTLRNLPSVVGRIEIRTLGIFSLEVDGRLVTAPRGRSKALTLLKMILSRSSLAF